LRNSQTRLKKVDSDVEKQYISFVPESPLVTQTFLLYRLYLIRPTFSLLSPFNHCQCLITCQRNIRVGRNFLATSVNLYYFVKENTTKNIYKIDSCLALLYSYLFLYRQYLIPSHFSLLSPCTQSQWHSHTPK